MSILWMAWKGTKWGAYVGLACGVLYSVGGLVVDLLTIGLNLGTAMAFMALVGMPLIFGALGFVLGAVIGVLSKVIRPAREGTGQ